MILYALPHPTDAVMTLPTALFIPDFYAGEWGRPPAGVGALIALRGMAIKLAVALGVLMGTGIPALFGLIPTASSQTPSPLSAKLVQGHCCR